MRLLNYLVGRDAEKIPKEILVSGMLPAANDLLVHIDVGERFPQDNWHTSLFVTYETEDGVEVETFALPDIPENVVAKIRDQGLPLMDTETGTKLMCRINEKSAA